MKIYLNENIKFDLILLDIFLLRGAQIDVSSSFRILRIVGDSVVIWIIVVIIIIKSSRADGTFLYKEFDQQWSLNMLLWFFGDPVRVVDLE